MAKIGIADKETLDKVARAVGVKGDNKIYGVRIDKNDSNPYTRCTYLGDAVGMTPARIMGDYSNGELHYTEFNYGDWADVWFVKDNFPCMLRPDGTIAYKLDPNNYQYKENGEYSAITTVNSNLNAMSAIPLVWLWQYEVGSYQYIYVANYKVNDNYHAYAHQKEDGSISNYLYMSIYKGCYYESSGSWDDEVLRLRSLSGRYPSEQANKYTTEQAIACAKANGENWNIKTWAQRNLLQCLLILMSCSTASQECFGRGVSSKGVLQYIPTGLGDTKGQFACGSDRDIELDTGELHNFPQVKVFHQEEVWGGFIDRIAGLVYDNGAFKVKMTPPYNVTGEDYKIVAGAQIKPGKNGGGGYISKTLMTEYGMLPTSIEGSSETYECDEVRCSNSGTYCALVGAQSNASGTSGTKEISGLFSMRLNSEPQETSSYFSASLSCLP